MNLELLSPFRRQIPDRVDATLTLPAQFHHKKEAANPSMQESDATPGEQKQKEESTEDDEWKAAYHVAFNRRGTYLAVGHASGTVAVHDFLSRTLSALYRPEDDTTKVSDGGEQSLPAVEYPNGVTSVTWSRRSRTLLAGALGDAHVRLIDATHPHGPEGCLALATESDGGPVDVMQAVTQEAIKAMTLGIPFKEDEITTKYDFVGVTRTLGTLNLTEGGVDPEAPWIVQKDREYEETLRNLKTGAVQMDPQSKVTRYPIVSFNFPHPVGGSLQIHPRDVTAGIAVLNNGSLVVFQAPSHAFQSYPHSSTSSPSVRLATLWDANPVTCAAFDPHGEKVYAGTKDGVLLCFQVNKIFESLQTQYTPMPTATPLFRIEIPGGPTAWHLLVSRNGRFILLNCADSALRVYDTRECEASTSLNAVKPKIFQDVVSKVPFASCDFSGDAEYLVGGCNANDKYDLYVWNATTGALMDRLTGPQVSLYSVAWHPTRSFLAVATSDGVVDIWGPRKDWTSFAPDFQALPMNVEYIEEEDEFDIVDNKEDEAQGEEDVEVDIVKVESVPVFASDSESESEVFTFETKISNIMGARGRNNPMVGWAGRVGGEDKD